MWVCVCVYACVCYVCMHMFTHTWLQRQCVHACGDQKSICTPLWDMVSHWIWCSAVGLGWLRSEPQGSQACLGFHGAGSCAYRYAPAAEEVSRNFKSRPTFAQCFTGRASSPSSKIKKPLWPYHRVSNVISIWQRRKSKHREIICLKSLTYKMEKNQDVKHNLSHYVKAIILCIHKLWYF